MDSIQEDQPIYDSLAQYAKGIKRYLEIGVRDGESLQVVVDNTELDAVTLCDTWGGEYGGTNEGDHNHILPIVAGLYNVTFLDGDSKETVPTITDTFDLILVDGDHSMLGCLIDMQNCWKLLRPGGLMIVDALSHPAHTYLDNCFLGFAIEKEATIVLHDTTTGHGIGILSKPEEGEK